MNSTANEPGKHWSFAMESPIDIGISDTRKKGLRLAIGAVVATVVLEMMMRVGAPNMLGIPPMTGLS
jgi:hypothetical protein